jgi:phosphatidylinositol alpha-1,6-mannosyltransferase
MSANRPLRILAIGHSYILALNRSTLRELSKNAEFEITAVSPKKFCGDFEPLTIEPEPPSSSLRLVGIDAEGTEHLHLYRYNFKQLAGVLSGHDYDLLYVWSEPYSFAAHQIATMSRKNVAFCFWTAQNLHKSHPFPLCEFENRVLERADGWLAAGNLVYETMIARGYPAERGQVLTLAVDTSAFRPNTSDETAEVLRDLGLKPPVIGFLGRLTEEKGLDILMASLEQVDLSLPWSLFLMGNGPYESKIAGWIKKRSLTERVKIRLLTHCDVPRCLAAMDLLIAPSQTREHWKEQFGRMLIEAFASGVPVIGSDSGEIPYVVDKAGKIVPEGDVGAWAKAIEEMLRNPAARKRYRQVGLKRSRLFSSSAVAQELGKFFKEYSVKARQ